MKIRRRWFALGLLAAATGLILYLGFWPVPPEASTRLESTLSSRRVCPPKTIVASGSAQTLTVHPGESIQQLVDQAHPGDAVQVLPGTYHEQVIVRIDHLTLHGVSENGQRPILDGEGRLGNGVIACADQFDVENLEFRNYTLNGVLAEDIDGVTIRYVFTDHTGLYGFYPVRSSHILIENCLATKASDTGIYVGQSKDILIRDNEAYANVAGFEIDAASNALVTHNYFHDNTAGVLMFILPGGPRKETSGNRILNNRIIANNLANFAATGALVAGVPAGSGLIIIATNDNEIAGNEVRDNKSVGIALVGLRQMLPKRTDFDVETEPKGNWIHDNSVQDNGTNPSPAAKATGLPGTDLLWDGTGWNNSWEETAARRFPPWLPGRDWSDFMRRIYYRLLAVLRLIA